MKYKVVLQRSEEGVAATNRLDACKPMVDRIRQALETARPGVVTKVAA
jgi:hypothetical protein